MGSMAVILLQMLLIVINGVMATTDLLSAEDQNTPLLCSRSDAAVDPFYEIRYGQDVIWQIPPNPKAVVFLAHGMSQHPFTFFDSAPTCRQCQGLPEHRKATLTALARGYAVLMVKSVGAYWLPWSAEWPVVESLDRTIVINVIREWTKEKSLEHLPLAAFGFSSGGNFTTLLTLDLDIKSQVLFCTPGEFELLKHANAVSFPPTLFVAMPVDNGPDGFYTKALVARRILDSKGVFSKQIDVWPSSVHPLMFAERIPCIEPTTSRNIYLAYKSEGWLDERDYLTKNPGDYDWEGVLWKHKPLAFCAKSNDLCLAKDVKQELDVAYAYHSLASSALVDVYNWLDDTMFLGNSDRTGFSASR